MSEKLLGIGREFIQVAGDLHVTIIHGDIKKKLSKVSVENRKKITMLVADIDKIEGIGARIIRSILNRACNVKSIEEMTNDTALLAITYLDGWLACANEEKQSERAMIAQIIRIWNVIDNKSDIEIIAQNLFGTSTLTNLNYLQLRCLLAYATVTWKSHWGNKK